MKACKQCDLSQWNIKFTEIEIYKHYVLLYYCFILNFIRIGEHEHENTGKLNFIGKNLFNVWI